MIGDAKIPWSLFNKEPLKGRNFTFWEWFHAAIEVVRRSLSDHWKDATLEFMSRQQAHQQLLEKPPGTFLIRFSDGGLGAVTIAWCCEKHGRKEIWYLQPWSSKDFSIRNLADRIFDIPELTHLYPNIPKEQAFGRYKSNEVPTDSNPQQGYVSAGIIARILQPHDQQSQQVNNMQTQQWMAASEFGGPFSPEVQMQAQDLEFPEGDFSTLLTDANEQIPNNMESFARYFPLGNN